MATKEIEVWFYKSDIKNEKTIYTYLKPDNSWKIEMTKARMIFEVPEKRIEITKEKVEKAVFLHIKHLVFNEQGSQITDDILKELGF